MKGIRAPRRKIFMKFEFSRDFGPAKIAPAMPDAITVERQPLFLRRQEKTAGDAKRYPERLFRVQTLLIEKDANKKQEDGKEDIRQKRGDAYLPADPVYEYISYFQADHGNSQRNTGPVHFLNGMDKVPVLLKYAVGEE